MDLNADLGEGMGEDEALLRIVTSANIACGGHTGNRGSMQAAVGSALREGVALGAHPSYPDREEFGRRFMRIGEDALATALDAQIGALTEVASEEGARVRYIKPHGALYHAVLDDLRHAHALASVAARYQLPLLLAPQARERAMGEVARDLGVEIHAEGFADRGYDDGGALLPRGAPGAVLTEPGDAVAQALDLAQGQVRTGTGRRLDLAVRSVCVHGDTPGAVEIARAIRFGLASARVEVKAWSADE